MNGTFNDQSEWLETDGLGGFASGTVGGIRTRRYHGLLMCATNPPTGRFMLVNGLEAFVTTAAGTFPLSSQRYDGQVVYPDGFRFLQSFSGRPWPTWTFKLPDGTVIEHELFLGHEQTCACISWKVIGTASRVKLTVRPLLSGRDYHALHRENATFNFTTQRAAQTVTWKPYAGVPSVVALSNGDYQHEPVWYRNFFYQEEWLRGFEATEDLASPGAFVFDLSRGEAQLQLAADHSSDAIPAFADVRNGERGRRPAFRTSLHQSADQYLVRRGSRGKTIIAGYPWFADWGRDTFISLRGLCLATGRVEEAREILLSWSDHVSDGMLPNRFPDDGEQPEYNSVDASLWYVIAVFEFLDAATVSNNDRAKLLAATDAILSGYANGTRHGIRADSDGLLASGAPGVQLTWMDAKIGDWVVTPRTGKAVEVNALWLNVLYMAGRESKRWAELYQLGRRNFEAKFWNPDGCLYDVIDVDHHTGAVDASFRPNQIFAVGGLPLVLVDQERAKQIVDGVERKLLTILGLRSLAQDQAGYRPRYTGGPVDRDSAYHQGTVWPWLIGPFVEAWVRVRGSTEQAKREARERFLAPLIRHLDEAGPGHVSEIADAEAPHMPRGCPFQAWSIAELIRLDQSVLQVSSHPRRATRSSANELVPA